MPFACFIPSASIILYARRQHTRVHRSLSLSLVWECTTSTVRPRFVYLRVRLIIVPMEIRHVYLAISFANEKKNKKRKPWKITKLSNGRRRKEWQGCRMIAFRTSYTLYLLTYPRIPNAPFLENYSSPPMLSNLQVVSALIFFFFFFFLLFVLRSICIRTKRDSRRRACTRVVGRGRGGEGATRGTFAQDSRRVVPVNWKKYLRRYRFWRALRREISPLGNKRCDTGWRMIRSSWLRSKKRNDGLGPDGVVRTQRKWCAPREHILL